MMDIFQAKDKEKLLNTVRRQLDMNAESPEDIRQIEKIVEAMGVVDRRFFVENIRYAYLDKAMPIGNNQTISQPSTVARFLQVADVNSGDDVLDVGSGSGWNACIAAYLCYPGYTLSIERIQELSENAKRTVDQFVKSLRTNDETHYKRLTKLEFKTGNIFNVEEINMQFDKIIISAGIPPSQHDLLYSVSINLLKEGGRLICPYMSGPIIIMDKINGKIRTEYTPDTFVFVPLIVP